MLKTFSLFSITFLYERVFVIRMNDVVVVVYGEPRVVYSKSWKTSPYQYAQAFVRLKDYDSLKKRYDELKEKVLS